ncbi:MAG: cytochrome c4 [Betaproteobacteria bacterium]|nr:cytochrome c4 [Betaproteobacteria bacterium]
MVYSGFRVLRTTLRTSLSVALISMAMLAGVSTSAVAADPAATKKPVDIAKGKAAAAAVCAGCHMPDGNSVIAQNPILAGQHAAYIEKQLLNFRLKPGAKEPERNNAIMLGFATMLSEDDMRNLGAFYASQTPKSASPKRKELVAVGERIYRAGVPEKGLPACAGCHGPGGAGIPAQYPKLAGQHPEYTEATLNAFRGGQRKNSGQMITIASKMSDAEVAAVSEYVASLR